MKDESHSVTYRLVRELFEAHAERGSINLRIELCNAEEFTMDVGRHPGFTSPRSFVLGLTILRWDKKELVELELRPRTICPPANWRKR